MHESYFVEVKDRGYTYHAKYGNTTASATQGQEFAARRVISKYTGIPMCDLKAEFTKGLTYQVTRANNESR